MASQGHKVVVVSSGDPGVFAMASAVFEALEDWPEAQALNIRVLPGITAMLAAAAALGAPLASEGNTGANTAASADHQWTLLGVVAGASGKGSALLSVDGQAPKAYLPGQTVAPGWVLHSVGHRLARLAPSLQDTPSVILELPK